MKMHLRGSGPANEGAQRLAWWIGERLKDDPAAFDTLAEALRVGVMVPDRLISGELRPAEAEAMRIMLVTQGAVLPRDWYRVAGRGWFDAPPARDRVDGNLWATGALAA